MVRARSIVASFTLFTLFTPFTLSSCTKSSAGAAAPGGETVATNADDGKTFTLAKGATLAIKLPLQSGTGFGWELANLGGTALAQQGERTSEGATGAPGGEQKQVFRFVANSAGSASIDLEFRRGPTPPMKTFHVNVTVQ
jgi:predicted secreted protein